MAMLPISDFTLAWTHSIEKIRWEEDWRVTPAGLEVIEARVRGTGAGMEPPADAILRNGVWHYRPVVTRMEGIVLARSSIAADYEFCVAGKCQPLSEAIKGIGTAESVKFVTCRGDGGEN